DHLPREVAQPHRLADLGMHGIPAVPNGFDAVRRAIGHADEAIADVNAGLEVDPARLDGRQDTDQEGDLDGTGGVEPLVGPVGEVEAGLVVMDGDGNRLRTHVASDPLDLRGERPFRLQLHLAPAGGSKNECYRGRAPPEVSQRPRLCRSTAAPWS